MLKRAGHAVHTSVLAGQRAAARAGVPAGGFRGTFTFISQLQDMISKIRARLYLRNGTGYKSVTDDDTPNSTARP